MFGYVLKLSIKKDEILLSSLSKNLLPLNAEVSFSKFNDHAFRLYVQVLLKKKNKKGITSKKDSKKNKKA
jgi:hypothetical protein